MSGVVVCFCGSWADEDAESDGTLNLRVLCVVHGNIKHPPLDSSFYKMDTWIDTTHFTWYGSVGLIKSVRSQGNNNNSNIIISKAHSLPVPPHLNLYRFNYPQFDDQQQRLNGGHTIHQLINQGPLSRLFKLPRGGFMLGSIWGTNQSGPDFIIASEINSHEDILPPTRETLLCSGWLPCTLNLKFPS